MVGSRVGGGEGVVVSMGGGGQSTGVEVKVVGVVG